MVLASASLPPESGDSSLFSPTPSPHPNSIWGSLLSSCLENMGQTSHVAMASSVLPSPFILASIRVQDIGI